MTMVKNSNYLVNFENIIFLLGKYGFNVLIVDEV